MKRNVSRIKAMMLLYSYDLIGESTELVDLNDLINEEETLESDDDFVIQLIKGVQENQSLIDRYIHRSIKNYTLERLSYVDRSLIRIAVYEMLYTQTPKSIIINEVLNIIHEYSETSLNKSAAFANSLLDRIAEKINHDRS